MADFVRLLSAFVCAACGMAWLALAMKPHWKQVQSKRPHSDRVALRLRITGAAALALSLAACVSVDHLSMAILVWVMTLSAAAVSVAMLLAYWPRGFSWLASVTTGLGNTKRA
jgi:hypothetical protein